MHNWRIYITDPTGTNTRLVQPLNDGLTWKWARDGGRTMRLTLETRLLLKEQDYWWLYDIETSPARYDPCRIEVQRYCGGTWSVFWNGELLLRSCDWNVSRCEVEASLKPDDAKRCYDEVRGTKVNIIGLGGSISAAAIMGYIDTVICGPTFYGSIFPSSLPQNAACIVGGLAWSLRRNRASTLLPNGGGDYNGWIETTWVRERLDNVPCLLGVPSPPSGTGWVLLNNNCPTGCDWVRELTTTLNGDTSDFGVTDGVLDYKYDIGGVDSVGTVSQFDNGRLLSVALDLLVASCSYTVVSDFLNINPDNTAPSNAAYISAAANLTYVAIWQKSDIKRPNANYNATGGYITLEQMLNNLQVVFNAQWRIEGAVLRIEHVSYWDNTANGLDLTTTPNAQYIQGLERYTYSDAEMPRREVFAWMDAHPSGASFHDGQPIEYTRGADDVTHQADIITTDMLLCQQHPDIVTDEGFVMANLTMYGGNYYITSQNRHMSFTALHNNYYRDRRPQPQGKMNGAATVFNSVARNRRQIALEVPNFCCDDLTTFDPAKLVLTQIGWGELDEATMTTKDNTLTLTITHE